MLLNKRGILKVKVICKKKKQKVEEQGKFELYVFICVKIEN